MIGNKVPYRVLLPERLFKEAQDRDHLKIFVLLYMRHYPEYVVKSVRDGFAICYRR
jgi:hypothetical protein